MRVRVCLLAALSTASCIDWVEVGAFDADAEPGLDASMPPVEPPPSDDSGTSPSIVVPVSTTRLAAGALSTCALRGDAVVCWGDNEDGTLGSGAFEPESRRSPEPVVELGAARAVVGGPFAHCAILQDGSARCWGESIFGTLAGVSGEGTLATTPIPHDYFGLGNDVAQLSHGYHFGCAITTSGRGKCWGLAGTGQLGNGSDADEFVARDVSSPGEPLVQISASMGGLFACALGASGAVYCWGDNDRGQLGEGTRASPVPVAVAGLGSPARSVSAGRSHVCAGLEDGSVRCWGDDRAAQVGSGAVTPSPHPPELVPGLAAVRSVHAGADHTCALVGDGAVWCWGDNVAGQIADGNGTRPPSEVLASGALEVSAGFYHTCILQGNQRISCRGDDSRGQTGTGDFSL